MIALLIWLVVIGIVVWFLTTQLPFIDPTFRMIIRFVGILFAIIIVLNAFGMMGPINAPVPTIR